MANYSRFNRHEIFTSNDRSTVMDAINEVLDHKTENMLFGLFDGYLYDELPSLLEKEDFDTSAILALIEKTKGHTVEPVKENTYNPVQKQREFDSLINQAVAMRKSMSTTMDPEVYKVMFNYSAKLIKDAQTLNLEYLKNHKGYDANFKAATDAVLVIGEEF